MSKRVTIAKAGTVALAGVMALSIAAPVQAQSRSQTAPSYTAESPKGYYYDPCRRDAAQRGTVGGLMGGAAGAVIGSNVAARNARTEGALLGGLLGMIAGASVGNKTAACAPGGQYQASAPPPPRAEAPYYGRDAYADRAAAEARDDAYASDSRGDRYRLTERTPGADGCTLAESPIYMPDGRTQTRFVRVCRDASGKYAVVD